MLTFNLSYSLDLLSLHQSNPKRYPFLLESITQSKLSRYSILFAFPLKTITANHDGEDDFLNMFDTEFSLEKYQENTSELPFTGGWFVYLSYELAKQIEPTLDLPKEKNNLPTAQAVRIPAAVIVDHQSNKTTVVCEKNYVDEFEKIQQNIKSVGRIRSAYDKTDGNLAIKLDVLAEEPEETYLNDVERIRDYIAAGDVFQVNYSRLWQAKTKNTIKPADLYQTLREKNPAPFAALCVFDDWAIISSSPERLVCVNNQIAETRPIAGTRPRSESTEADQSLLDELIAHPKERAEHIMLIDLERNDLGRICQAGSVEVDELMTLESYQHVHHIVSNIRGKLKKGITPGQVIRAVFPGGTITGCPKIRCMEIIAELEKTGRGAYTGSVGYINHNGDMDFNILIRTMIQVGDTIEFRAGAGIVFDAIAENELKETRHKAKGLLKVFET